jgi:methylmalonyl-CoA mutase N-terminal domain/subunit
MTDEMERRAEEVFAHLLDIGDGSMLEGVYAGIENGYFQGEIADAAYRFERQVNAGTRIVVGVNAFTEGDDGGSPTLYISEETEDIQLKRLAAVKQRRDGRAVHDALERVKSVAADPSANTMPALIQAVQTLATEGEIVRALEDVFGSYVEKATV